MAIVHRTIRRLKDAFECSQPYDEIKRHQRIIGRQVLSTKKLPCLPPHHDGNYNMNFNEIPVAPPLPLSLITNNQHDKQQSKIKNMVIDELKSFFASRNQNNNINPKIKTQFQASASIENYVIQERKQIISSSPKKQIVQRKDDFEVKSINKEQLNDGIYHPERLLTIFPTATTALLTSLSILTSILLRSDFIRSSKRFSTSLNILSDTLFYSTSFSLGCFGARCIKRTHPSHIHLFGNMLTKSLFLHTFLTLLTDDKNVTQRLLTPIGTASLSKSLLFTRSDVLIRIITSTLHLIAGFAIHFDNKNVI